MMQLRNPEEAEDAVQEALVGALKNAGSFRGEAALRTWVFAILRNKLADIQRQRASATASGFDGALLEDGMTAAFDQRGKWRGADATSRWDHPGNAEGNRA